MKALKNLLQGISTAKSLTSQEQNLTINQVHFDSRKVQPGDLFVALRGTATDGHQYIPKVIAAGAKAVVCEVLPQVQAPGVTYIQVPNSQSALPTIVANYYNHPSRKLKLIGVTGTNGKTTVATLLYQLFRKAGYSVGLLSTVTIRIHDTAYDATLTTPDILTINKYLAQMNAEGVAFCFMEVSSHGIHQKRIVGLHFAGALFTNLSHDHLDYHKTFAAYRDTKKQFFDQLPQTAFALTNADDKNGPVMLQNTKAQKYTYALKSYAEYSTQVIERRFDGQLLKINGRELWVKLIGDFNAYNLLAIYATADLLGLDNQDVLKHMSELESVAGRLQYFTTKNNITAIVDYSHTPDALKNVLKTLNALRTGRETLITVVGCGGDRDTTKRPIMAQIASELSNQVIFTSDNPRSESPAVIIAEMEAGVAPQNTKKVLSIENRRQAIQTACTLALANDIILVAGKGHETYQETHGIRVDFDDLKELKAAFNRLEQYPLNP